MITKKNPSIAAAFGVIAIATAALLLVNAPAWLNWIAAVFWLGTGLLGFYVALRK